MPASEIRWAKKVSRAKVRQLYLADAAGIVDRELLDEVGTALYARCQSVLLVSRASVRCPRCGQTIKIGFGRPEEERIACPTEGCGWETTPRQWHASWRHRDLNGSRALSAFQAYVDQYGSARSRPDKMLLIDQLIHAFHRGIVENTPHRSAANNLIEGSHRQVVDLLDELAYGDASTPGLEENAGAWREQMARAMRARRSGL